MLLFQVRKVLGKQPVAAGVETGRAHAALVGTFLNAATVPPTGVLVGWDFEGVEVASISYIKATLLHTVAVGRWHAQALTHVELDWVRNTGASPRDVFAVGLNVNEEVAESIDHAFARQGWPVLTGTSIIPVPPDTEGDQTVQPSEWLDSAILLGQIDTAATKTLEAVEGAGQANALGLHERFARTEGSVGPTGWNNRLADLYHARLARRRRQGKSWIYHPLARKVNIYGQGVSRS